MSPAGSIFLAIAGVVSLALAILVVRSRLRRRSLTAIESSLVVLPGKDVFDASMLEGLPETARRFFLHAIEEGTPLSSSVFLRQSARMKADPARPHFELSCSERLTPGRGFVWRARSGVGPIPIGIFDHYFEGQGSLTVELLGLFRIAHDAGADVARSARGRLAAEALWCPGALLPRANLRWEPVDDEHVKIVQRIDGDEIAVQLELDGSGKLSGLSMQRHGNEGRSDWGPTPYGFEVLDEATFSGYTIASRLLGGWWYGSERYKEEDCSEFVIESAEFD